MKKLILFELLIGFAFVLPLAMMAADLQLIPAPQKVKFSGEKIYLPSKVMVTGSSDCRKEQQLVTDVLGQFGIKTGSGASFTFRLSCDRKTKHASGYSINVTPDACYIAASEAVGVFYGIQTVRQLFGRDEKGIFIHKVKIMDYPKLKMRGVFLSLRNVTANTKSIDNLKRMFAALAELKVNTLILEFADNIKYRSRKFPKTAKRAFTPQQVKDLVAYARSLHFEVVPYLQTLSHCPWILSNPDNVKLLEDPKNTGWHTAWCPYRPATKAFIKDIIDESIEIFQPKYFHIGVDEVGWGPFNKCPVCKKHSPAEELRDHILYMHSLLKVHGVRAIIYQDELWPSPKSFRLVNIGGSKILDQLPKDIIINVWYYGTDTKYFASQLKFFSSKGFKTIGASFDNPQNTIMMSEQIAKSAGGLGMNMTYWYRAGNWSKYQISDVAASITTLLAAYSWNFERPKPDKLTYDTVSAFMQPWLNNNSELEDLTSQPISVPYNHRLGFKPGSWPGEPSDDSLKALPAEMKIGKTPFSTGPVSSNNILAVSGRPGDGLPAEQVMSGINLKAQKLVFLHSCGIPDNIIALSYLFGAIKKPVIGEYIVEYDDQTSVSIPLRYRDNITSWNSRLSPLFGRRVYVTATAKEHRFMLSSWEWSNPNPDKIITRIKLKTSNYHNASIALVALSARSKPLNNVLWEDFDESSIDALWKRWIMTCSNIGSQVKTELVDVGGGRGLKLSLPPITKNSSRINLDCAIALEPSLWDKNNLSMTIQIQDYDSIHTGFYLGNKFFSKYGVTYKNLKNGTSKVKISRAGLSTEHGALKNSDIQKFRMAFFLKPNSKPSTIIIGPIRLINPILDIPYNNNSWY